MSDTVCPFCGAYYSRSCELEEETGSCPWEGAQEEDMELGQSGYYKGYLIGLDYIGWYAQSAQRTLGYVDEWPQLQSLMDSHPL